jgi:hypothetical protein
VVFISFPIILRTCLQPDHFSNLKVQKQESAKKFHQALQSPLSSNMFSIILATFGVAVSMAHALTPLQTFYPPNLNSTTYITNSSLGTYGGVYQAPTREPNITAPYGSYDYCTMPHPRVQEYPLPEPVKNGSVKANLVYLEYLQRHQRRTPYNILPGGEVCLSFKVKKSRA